LSELFWELESVLTVETILDSGNLVREWEVYFYLFDIGLGSLGAGEWGLGDFSDEIFEIGNSMHLIHF
jgi:hypothetical protein